MKQARWSRLHTQRTLAVILCFSLIALAPAEAGGDTINRGAELKIVHDDDESERLRSAFLSRGDVLLNRGATAFPLSYTVTGADDSMLRLIARAFYNNEDFAKVLALSNGLAADGQLEAGTTLYLPDPANEAVLVLLGKASSELSHEDAAGLLRAEAAELLSPGAEPADESALLLVTGEEPAVSTAPADEAAPESPPQAFDRVEAVMAGEPETEQQPSGTTAAGSAQPRQTSAATFQTTASTSTGETSEADAGSGQTGLTAMEATYYTTDSLNLRTGPGTSYNKLLTIPDREPVRVTALHTSGWYQVDYSGTQGFVNGSWLTEEQPPQQTAGGQTAGQDQPDDYVVTPASQAEMDLYLGVLAAEAGAHWGYEGTLLVAQTIVNRVLNGYWGSSLTSVLSAPNQFTVYQTGAWRRASLSDVQYQAAMDALRGQGTLPRSSIYFCTDWAYASSSWFQSLTVTSRYENVYFMAP